MLKPNPPGRPTTLTREIIDRIIPFVRESIGIPVQVARLSKIPKSTLNDWLKQGREDQEAGKSTIHAQLSAEFEQKKGEIINIILHKLMVMQTYQSLSFLLERGDREVFGADAGVIADIKATQEEILKNLNGETPNAQALSYQKRFIENEIKDHEGG